MVYKWFAAVKRAYNAEIVAYVIMPNYLHVILHFHDEIFNLNTSVANGKRIIAYEIINRLEQAGNNELLNRLKKMVTERERKKGQLHKVFKTLLMQRQLLPMRF